MRTLPGEILLDFNLSDKTLLADSLSELAGRKINVQTKPRGDRARYLKLAHQCGDGLNQQTFAAIYRSPATDRACQRVEIAGSEADGVL